MYAYAFAMLLAILSTPFILFAAFYYSFVFLEKEDLKREIENKKNFGISNEEFWNRCGWDKTVLKEWADEIRKMK